MPGPRATIWASGTTSEIALNKSHKARRFYRRALWLFGSMMPDATVDRTGLRRVGDTEVWLGFLQYPDRWGVLFRAGKVGAARYFSPAPDFRRHQFTQLRR